MMAGSSSPTVTGWAAWGVTTSKASRPRTAPEVLVTVTVCSPWARSVVSKATNWVGLFCSVSTLVEETVTGSASSTLTVNSPWSVPVLVTRRTPVPVKVRAAVSPGVEERVRVALEAVVSSTCCQEPV